MLPPPTYLPPLLRSSNETSRRFVVIFCCFPSFPPPSNRKQAGPLRSRQLSMLNSPLASNSLSVFGSPRVFKVEFFADYPNSSVTVRRNRNSIPVRLASSELYLPIGMLACHVHRCSFGSFRNDLCYESNAEVGVTREEKGRRGRLIYTSRLSRSSTL